MPIDFKNNKFHIYNKYFSYIIEVSADNDLLHTHFGAPVVSDDIFTTEITDGSWQAYKVVNNEYYKLGKLPCEYPTALTPDYRSPAFEAEMPNGINTFQFKYKSYEVIQGKPQLKGLPAVYAEKDDSVETLKIITVDEFAGIEISLYFTVFEAFSAICRHTEIKNIGSSAFKIKNAQSISMDFPLGEYEYIHLTGAAIREKHIVRDDVTVGNHGFEVRHGSSSAHENPFMIFGDKGMNEHYGNVYGISLIYSGNHKFNIESIVESIPRIQAGINPFMFSFQLEPKETFVTPEAVVVYSNSGISKMSKTFHNLYRTRLCRGKYRDIPRPILVNNWEATYFKFNREKLLGIADVAAEIGAELFVLDDGWFGKRDNDRCALGDWVVNEEKMGGSIKSFAEEINNKGLKFGIWFEPEMISEDSDLYRAHPEWAVSIPGKEPLRGRWQLLLDYTRKDVRDYIVTSITNVLSNANIEYVKWDKNRATTEAFSSVLPIEKQGEFFHRYILGLYDVLERITSAFPNILFESCSGGGGRNDPGMLYYMPQTWLSDNTDAITRQYIQYGASLVYPVSSWGTHVSAVPNHQTGRITSLSTRGTVAMNGSFGYELDLTKITDEEKAEMQLQVERYKKNRELVNSGDYYRILSPYETNYSSWLYVSKDKLKALLYFTVAGVSPVTVPLRIKLYGLDEDKIYSVDGRKYFGKSLMNYGIDLQVTKDKDNWILEINSVN